jgi:hypothetical protein
MVAPAKQNKPQERSRDFSHVGGDWASTWRARQKNLQRRLLNGRVDRTSPAQTHPAVT